MIAGLLAAATLAASATEPPPVVVVTGRAAAPVKVDMQGDDNPNSPGLVAVWPLDAYKARITGRVTLGCRIDVYGLAESCSVISETPKGKGFGAAALQMRPTIKLDPFMVADGPAARDVSIPVGFRAPDIQTAVGGNQGDSGLFADAGAAFGAGGDAGSGMQIGNGLVLKSVTMLDNPVWSRAASFEDRSRARPRQAGEVDGYAVAHCQVGPGGDLSACQVIKEAPEKLGFGKAAVALASRFQVAPEWRRPPSQDAALWVDLPIRFPRPGAAEERSVTSPRWLVGPDPDTAPKLFPPEAVAKGLTSGIGAARCVVAADGGLSDCAPEAGDPDGLGFSEAAVRLASVMRMNPWSSDAAPVDGAIVHLRFQLNLVADRQTGACAEARRRLLYFRFTRVP